MFNIRIYMSICKNLQDKSGQYLILLFFNFIIEEERYKNQNILEHKTGLDITVGSRTTTSIKL